MHIVQADLNTMCYISVLQMRRMLAFSLSIAALETKKCDMVWWCFFAAALRPIFSHCGYCGACETTFAKCRIRWQNNNNNKTDFFVCQCKPVHSKAHATTPETVAMPKFCSGLKVCFCWLMPFPDTFRQRKCFHCYNLISDVFVVGPVMVRPCHTVFQSSVGSLSISLSLMLVPSVCFDLSVAIGPVYRYIPKCA